MWGLFYLQAKFSRLVNWKYYTWDQKFELEMGVCGRKLKYTAGWENFLGLFILNIYFVFFTMSNGTQFSICSFFMDGGLLVIFMICGLIYLKPKKIWGGGIYTNQWKAKYSNYNKFMDHVHSRDTLCWYSI